MSKFFVKKGLSQDESSAAKNIEHLIGKCENLDYEDFYRLFARGIFRISLLDLMKNIEQMASQYPELPLILKIGAYRRHLMMSTLNKEQS